MSYGDVKINALPKITYQARSSHRERLVTLDHVDQAGSIQCSCFNISNETERLKMKSSLHRERTINQDNSQIMILLFDV